MPTYRIKLATLVSCALTLLFVGSIHGFEATSTSATTQITSYIQERRQLARDLESALVDNRVTSSYRVVPVTGPMYGIGAAIDPDNPLDLETRRCVVSKKSLPEPDPWVAFPTWTSRSQVGLEAGLPAKISSILFSVGATAQRSQLAFYQFSDISQQLVAKGDFYSLIANKECLKQLKQHPKGLLLVRGVVIGRETFKTDGRWLADADIKVLSKTVSLFSVKYDGRGNFELTDTQPSAKFIVVTLVLPPDRGATIEGSLRAPTDAELGPLEQSARLRR